MKLNLGPRNFPLSAPRLLLYAAALVALALLPLSSRGARAQGLSAIDRERANGMLDVIKDEIKKSYYDPDFHGVDVEARFKLAKDKIKQATSLGQAFGTIAQALLDFNDSHTFFIPPRRSATVNYGWQMKMVGEDAFITAVRPGSDAEAQGVKPGDLILAVDGYKPTRSILWKMTYRYYLLAPQASVRLALQSPDGKQRELDVKAKVKEGKRRLDFSFDNGGEDIFTVIRELEDDDRFARHRYIDGEQMFIWQMKAFDMTEDKIDEMVGKAGKSKALIIDLRGNGGGAEVTLQRLIGNLIDHDVKIGDVKRRKETKPLVAKTRGADKVYKGPLVVLVDNRSGSAAEVFARVVQLEKRGTVIGDRTAGHVMRAYHHSFDMGAETIISYGVSITDSDLVMTDGKSLEHTGVTPDELLLPSAEEMAGQRDPVLARAAAVVGISLSPEKAGQMFPVEWQK
ncbi:MAG TPA: S41 family peptidase [Pyrinomonadaceae bacterium]|nr:S41 family peptidase [Pyrinomonadaceae bacterium]